MSKNALDTDFGDVADFGSTIDINEILDKTPAIDPDEEEIDDDKKGDDDKKKDSSPDDDLNDINRILDKAEDETDDEGGDDDEDEEVEKDKDSDPSPDDTQTSSSDAPFTVIFARDLMERGVLSDFNEEEYQKLIETEGEASAFRALIQSEVDGAIEETKADLDEGYQHYLELIGQGVPDEAAGSLVGLNEKFNKISDDDLDDETQTELRKSVLSDYYKLTTRFSDAKIEKLVTNTVDMGEDIMESKEALKNIKSIITEQLDAQKAEAQRQRDLAVQERTRQMELLKDHINALSEIIPEQRINKQTKEKMYNLITKPVQDNAGRTTNAIWAKRSEDPISFDAKLAYLVETGFFEKDKPWDKMKNIANTKKASALEKHLDTKKNTGSSSGTSVVRNMDQSQVNIKKLIDSTKSIL